MTESLIDARNRGSAAMAASDVLVASDPELSRALDRVQKYCSDHTSIAEGNLGICNTQLRNVIENALPVIRTGALDTQYGKGSKPRCMIFAAIDSDTMTRANAYTFLLEDEPTLSEDEVREALEKTIVSIDGIPMGTTAMCIDPDSDTALLSRAVTEIAYLILSRSTELNEREVAIIYQFIDAVSSIYRDKQVIVVTFCVGHAAIGEIGESCLGFHGITELHYRDNGDLYMADIPPELR